MADLRRCRSGSLGEHRRGDADALRTPDARELPTTLERGLEIEPWSVLYFVSFVLDAAFIVLNVLIGVVLNSMEQARELEATRERQEAIAHGRLPDPGDDADLVERIKALRHALEELEHAFRAHPHHDGSQRASSVPGAARE